MYEDPGTSVSEGVVGQEEWVRRWKDNEAFWQQNEPDKCLAEYEQKLFGGKKGARVFVPLCGKSPDLLWMYERGYTVVGVELVEDPIRELYTENSIPYNVEKLADNASVYKSEDGRLQIYVGNLFSINFNNLEKCDAIWDSRSLIAINKADRDRYRDVLLAVMQKDARYFLITIEYDTTVWPGPPHSISNKVIDDLYGARCRIETLSDVNVFATAQKTQTGLEQANAEPGKVVTPVQRGQEDPALIAIKNSSFLMVRLYCLVLKPV